MSDDTDSPFIREQVMDDFLDGVERCLDEPEGWTPAVVASDGAIQHMGEEITEKELRRRWEKTGPHGEDEIKVIDFRTSD